jgi:glycosyltransferase involved in cell wall biosynthesis
VRASGGGWVADGGDPSEFAAVVATALRNIRERHRRGELALRFAGENFGPDFLASQLEEVLASAVHRDRFYGLLQ